MKTTILAVVIAATATATTAAPQGAKAKLDSFQACMVQAGFQEGPDFRLFPEDRQIAGRKIMVGFKIRLANVVLAEPALMEIVDACHRQAGITPSEPEG